MPKVLTKIKLLVRSWTPWRIRIEAKHRGKVVPFDNYQAARDFADQHGYDGIRIEYQK